MHTTLAIDAEYVVICRDQQRALALKMHLDVEAPNILAVDENNGTPPQHTSSEMSLKDLAVGDRLRVTQIRSEEEDFAIPMCTRQNSVHWYEASPPRYQAMAIRACITVKSERVSKLAFTKKMNRGKLSARQRFFDPFERRERNLPGNARSPQPTIHGLVRVLYIKLPTGTNVHSRIKCFVPNDYTGKLKHFVLSGEDSYFVTAQEAVYEPLSYAVIIDAELAALEKLFAPTNTTEADKTIADLLTAVAALVQCCADKEWRHGDRPSILSVRECLRIIQKQAYTDLEQPKYGNLLKLLTAVLTRLVRATSDDGTTDA